MSKKLTKNSSNKNSDEYLFTDSLEQTIENVSSSIENLEDKLNDITNPVRKKVLNRFPILFTLLTTFGITAVFFGFERILSEIDFLYKRPWLILLIGILILMATGTLYKVLDHKSRK